MTLNYRLIATEIGDALKYESSVNEINRIAKAVFRFDRESFPTEGITSARATLIYEWIMSLAKQRMTPSERNGHLVEFCTALAPAGNVGAAIQTILTRNRVVSAPASSAERDEFMARGFHAEVHKHSLGLFLGQHYLHAVLEACKGYNKAVRDKGQSDRDGPDLMLRVWSPDKGVLKVTPCRTKTERDVQEGVSYISAGVMKLARNPTAHEPAADWPVNKEDCLDLLSVVSFLFRQLDNATYFSSEQN